MSDLLRTLLREAVDYATDVATEEVQRKAKRTKERAVAEAMAALGMKLIEAAGKRAPDLIERAAKYLATPHRGNPRMMRWMGGP